MIRYLALIFLLTGCQVHTRINKCDQIAQMQWREISARVGRENAGIERFYSDHPRYLYHDQAMERIPPNKTGTWYYYPNYIITTTLSKYPQRGCKPYKRLK